MKKTVRLAEKGVPLKICVITYPFGKKTKPVLLFNLLEILEPISDKLYVITGDILKDEIPNNRKCHLINIKMEKELRRHLPMCIAFPIWLFNYIMGQIKMSYNLFKISKNIDIVIFFLGYDYLLPILTSKILRKKSVMIATMSSKGAKAGYNKVFYYISRTIEKIVYALSDRIGIAMESESFIPFIGLERHRTKIVPLGSYFLNANFKIKKRLNERENIIGYVGRLSIEKGVIKFVKAIPFILSKKNNVRFLIVGDGRLMDDMKNILDEAECLDKVDFVGWIPHEKIPDYLNEMKFHILPSHTEAFGGTAIEAMACGAISIANSVGGIPDVIKDGETGFLLKDNQPQTIANKVLDAWDDPKLEKIQKNAKEFIDKTFSYEKAIERCKTAFHRFG